MGEDGGPPDQHEVRRGEILVGLSFGAFGVSIDQADVEVLWTPFTDVSVSIWASTDDGDLVPLFLSTEIHKFAKRASVI